MSFVKIQRSIFQPIEDMIKIGLYKNEQEAIASLVQNQAKSKTELYSKKIKQFEKKYNTDFSAFETRIQAASEEDFEEWDDYILWESYVKAYQYWSKLA
jgi:tRNA nucleotidyltransferase/poly(A) polymerase